DGPFETGGHSKLKSIDSVNKGIEVVFDKDHYKVNYSLAGDWLKISYSYRPEGKYPYFGISFNYPEKKVKGIKWFGDGPDRVWKNRLSGMELGVWKKEYKKDS